MPSSIMSAFASVFFFVALIEITSLANICKNAFQYNWIFILYLFSFCNLLQWNAKMWRPFMCAFIAVSFVATPGSQAFEFSYYYLCKHNIIWFATILIIIIWHFSVVVVPAFVFWIPSTEPSSIILFPALSHDLQPFNKLSFKFQKLLAVKIRLLDIWTTVSALRFFFVDKRGF